MCSSGGRVVFLPPRMPGLECKHFVTPAFLCPQDIQPGAHRRPGQGSAQGESNKQITAPTEVYLWSLQTPEWLWNEVSRSH